MVKILRKIEKNADTGIFVTEFEHDDYGNVTAEIVKNHQGKIIKTIEYEYDYSIKTIPSQNSVPKEINEKIYSLQDFVIDASNKMAYESVSRIITGESTNMLYIYGATGLGKTHLLKALQQSNPDTKIIYNTLENFTNELINAIRYDKTSDFRNTYRNADILLLDDIQFLADKERTQEELFHTIEALINNNKIIVIAADVHPNNLQNIEERLISRFMSGDIAEITAPSIDTVVEIIKQTATKEKVEMPADVLEFIAKNTKNVRDAVGYVRRSMAYASLLNEQPSIKNVVDLFKD